MNSQQHPSPSTIIEATQILVPDTISERTNDQVNPVPHSNSNSSSNTNPQQQQEDIVKMKEQMEMQQQQQQHQFLQQHLQRQVHELTQSLVHCEGVKTVLIKELSSAKRELQQRKEQEHTNDIDNADKSQSQSMHMTMTMNMMKELEEERDIWRERALGMKQKVQDLQEEQELQLQKQKELATRSSSPSGSIRSTDSDGNADHNEKLGDLEKNRDAWRERALSMKEKVKDMELRHQQQLMQSTQLAQIQARSIPTMLRPMPLMSLPDKPNPPKQQRGRPVRHSLCGGSVSSGTYVQHRPRSPLPRPSHDSPQEVQPVIVSPISRVVIRRGSISSTTTSTSDTDSEKTITHRFGEAPAQSPACVKATATVTVIGTEHVASHVASYVASHVAAPITTPITTPMQTSSTIMAQKIHFRKRQSLDLAPTYLRQNSPHSPRIFFGTENDAHGKPVTRRFGEVSSDPVAVAVAVPVLPLNTVTVIPEPQDEFQHSSQVARQYSMGEVGSLKPVTHRFGEQPQKDAERPVTHSFGDQQQDTERPVTHKFGEQQQQQPKMTATATCSQNENENENENEIQHQKPVTHKFGEQQMSMKGRSKGRRMSMDMASTSSDIPQTPPAFLTTAGDADGDGDVDVDESFKGRMMFLCPTTDSNNNTCLDMDSNQTSATRPKPPRRASAA
jgi:hypothetical protein